MKVALSLIAVLLLAPSAAHAQRRARTRGKNPGPRIAAIARNAVARPIAMERADCSGFVEEVLRRAGIPKHGNTASLYREAEESGRLRRWSPRLGDLVFFDRTYDRDQNGAFDDLLTHIAIVTGVLRDGTVILAHRGNSGIRALRMNVKVPALHRGRRGRVFNDFLAEPGYGHQRLTGQLFRAFARPPRR